MSESFAHGALGAEQVGTFQVRLDQPLGPPGCIGGDKPEHSLDRLTNLVRRKGDLFGQRNGCGGVVEADV